MCFHYFFLAASSHGLCMQAVLVIHRVLILCTSERLKLCIELSDFALTQGKRMYKCFSLFPFVCGTGNIGVTFLLINTRLFSSSGRRLVFDQGINFIFFFTAIQHWQWGSGAEHRAPGLWALTQPHPVSGGIWLRHEALPASYGHCQGQPRLSPRLERLLIVQMFSYRENKTITPTIHRNLCVVLYKIL